MFKNLKWYMSATGLLVCASVHAIDFLDMGTLGYVFLSRTPSNSVTILAIVTTVLGFLITWFFFKKILKPLKVKEFKIFIFTLIAYLIFIVSGFLIRAMVVLLLLALGVPLWVVIGMTVLIAYILINALLLTSMALFVFPELSTQKVLKNMIYASVLSFLASILCLLIFYKIYPQQPNFIDLINQPKREPDRVREMVKHMPYSHDLSESDFR